MLDISFVGIARLSLFVHELHGLTFSVIGLPFIVMFTAEDFQIAEMVLDIIVRNAHDRVFFIVTFPDERPQLVLTRLVNQDDQKVWTLIPGGIWQRQLIGPEVINHFKNKK